MNVPFETVNVLEDDKLRNGMKQYSGWPTFPQVSERRGETVVALPYPVSHPIHPIPSILTTCLSHHLPHTHTHTHSIQVYLNGELVGGADIAIQLFQSGELAEMVEAAFAE